uniref:protein-glutamine gamma-glutamyltransferase E-like n=1 Tax=Semicossyphus pulcher TaxID=241346 RepID=UPI0037E79CDB
MPAIGKSLFEGVDLQCETNNTAHRTEEIRVDQLIVRRGQPFTLTLNLTEGFNKTTPLFINVATGGEFATQEQGTMYLLAVPDLVEQSPEAKAVWKVELDAKSSTQTGNLILTFTPPADAPIGLYKMVASYKDEKMSLAELTVLFNPWCAEDSVFLDDEKKRQEYVMNEHGKIFIGSADFIFSRDWDYGQFDESMVSICMNLLDRNLKHKKDPADDVAARCDPIYVGRVVSAMINSEDDNGVLEGQWETPYDGGKAPTHWTGSISILKQWQKNEFQPVKYGQCWVYAGVMCSVMRLLGIPCRTVTNFSSACDENQNLIIDKYHSEDGVDKRISEDSVWNFHVWLEGWMRRPDLSEDSRYDGWQVLDPTPQGESEGIYCCGPAAKEAILKGDTDLKYDVSFVYAEVNADCVDWLVKSDGSLEKIEADQKRVGKKISTKAVGSDEREDVTDEYKYKEGTKKERSAFMRACTTLEDHLREKNKLAAVNILAETAAGNLTIIETENEPRSLNEVSVKILNGTTEETDAETLPPPPKVTMRFEEVSKPENGQDVSLNLVLSSESTADRPLSISISIQAMKYNGKLGETIKTEKKKETLLPEKELSIPILVPFSVYREPMLDFDSMKISALVKDIENPDHPYLAEDNVVLLDPPITITISGDVRLNIPTEAEVVFKNPVNETLKDCSLTVSGSGLWRDEYFVKLGDMLPSTQFRVKLPVHPYKVGQKTAMVDFDSSVFRDIKASSTVTVKK